MSDRTDSPSHDIADAPSACMVQPMHPTPSHALRRLIAGHDVAALGTLHQDEPSYAAARAAYLARFPDTEFMFGFADFSLFLVTVRSVRFVAGFAQASSIPGDAYATLMSSASTAP